MLSIKMDTDFYKMIINKKSIDEIQDYLRDDNNTSNDRNKLNELINNWHIKYNINFNELGINDKWLIIIFLLNAYPTDLGLSIDTILYDKITNFIKYLIQINEYPYEYPTDFGKIIVTLKLVYDDWKKKDWNSNMQLIIGLYLQYEKAVNDYTFVDNNLRELWCNYKTELLKMIQELAPSRYEYHISKYRETNNDIVPSEIKKKVEDMVYNEYWMMLRQEYNDVNEEVKKEILENVINGYNELLKKLGILLKSDIPLITVIDIEEINIVWVLIENIKKYDSFFMDKVYDSIYTKWLSGELKIKFIDIIRLIYDRLEIIISLLNKEDE
jgi:hypothetical protein